MTLVRPRNLRVDLPLEPLAELCRRWRIARLDVFGSSLRDDFGESSDVDLLYVFEPDAQVGLLELVRLREELSGLLGRGVDLLSREAVERSRNPIRRQTILTTAEAIYER